MFQLQLYFLLYYYFKTLYSLGFQEMGTTLSHCTLQWSYTQSMTWLQLFSPKYRPCQCATWKRERSSLCSKIFNTTFVATHFHRSKIHFSLQKSSTEDRISQALQSNIQFLSSVSASLILCKVQGVCFPPQSLLLKIYFLNEAWLLSGWQLVKITLGYIFPFKGAA